MHVLEVRYLASQSSDAKDEEVSTAVGKKSNVKRVKDDERILSYFYESEGEATDVMDSLTPLVEDTKILSAEVKAEEDVDP